MATMHGDFSPEAAQRARRTIEAAGVFGDNAELIVAELADVPDEKILVALVTDDLKFNGVVQRRAGRMASLATDRAAAIERIAARRAQKDA
jgi:hypothetical protein